MLFKHNAGPVNWNLVVKWLIYVTNYNELNIVNLMRSYIKKGFLLGI